PLSNPPLDVTCPWSSHHPHDERSSAGFVGSHWEFDASVKSARMSGDSSCASDGENDMPQDLSIFQQIATRAEQAPEAIALLAPGRTPLTYRRLQTQINDTLKMLNARGVGRQDRVALVLPNGPEMVVAFLAVAAGATAAPLNPAYRADEFDFYLSDLRAKAVL